MRFRIQFGINLHEFARQVQYEIFEKLTSVD